MLKDIRKKVMQIANRLVKLGYIRACAMATAWKLVKTHSLSTRDVGTSFDNRQDVLELIAKYNPAQVSVKLVRNRSNAFDNNAYGRYSQLSRRAFGEECGINECSEIIDKGRKSNCINAKKSKN